MCYDFRCSDKWLILNNKNYLGKMCNSGQGMPVTSVAMELDGFNQFNSRFRNCEHALDNLISQAVLQPSFPCTPSPVKIAIR